MNTYTKAILRKPGKTFAAGITTTNLGKPDLEKALKQHYSYCEALQQCGLKLIVLEADERYPDGCFVEDAAIVTETLAILTNPGDPSRRGEVEAIREVLAQYKEIAAIKAPGTVDGGDILRVQDHFYIGRSKRTNAAGAKQLSLLLSKCKYNSTEIPVNSVLHLKTGVTHLGNNNFVSIVEFSKNFPSGQVICLDDKEAYAANCILINGKVLMPAGYPTAKQQIAKLGHPIIEVEMSEFQKMDGGLTCLSLLF
ncbi:MAG: N(G),N(G)-dimethylarginine dimethylaminohydrolase [Saprospiraceae bacterium]|nr:MAG: N(G),N(G)-dimethylarginine dimethylaminohydrolase [Saprospiraceae bacterium]